MIDFKYEIYALAHELTDIHNASGGLLTHVTQQVFEQKRAIASVRSRLRELGKLIAFELDPPKPIPIMCPGIDCDSVHEDGHSGHGCEHCSE